jgi:hypothetical protein
VVLGANETLATREKNALHINTHVNGFHHPRPLQVAPPRQESREQEELREKKKERNGAL